MNQGRSPAGLKTTEAEETQIEVRGQAHLSETPEAAWPKRAAPVAAPGVADHIVDHSRFGRTAKRAVDVIGSLLAIILLSPVLLAITLMIRIDSPGRAFFRQQRVGRDGELFAMRKFRTMIKDADAQKLGLLHMNDAAEGLFKIRQDPRVTRFGRILRSTSLDELPQLFDVLVGRMSLVGPRPLVPEEDATITGPFRRRLTMRPGMTGSWQVAGASRIPISEMAVLDATYVDRWTLRGDLKLLVMTVPHVIRRRGI